jgi:hypothetical protein
MEQDLRKNTKKKPISFLETQNSKEAPGVPCLSPIS